MRLRYARLTTAGLVRETNQDFLDFWESDDPLIREKQGSIAALADGVGGLEHGEIASRLAVETALQIFKGDPPDLAPYAELRRVFTAAAEQIHEQARKTGPMATTLVASIFRSHAVSVANIGDSRAYLIRQKMIRRLTRDHTATALPVKLGLMLERNAMVRPERSQLTRSVGLEPFCQPDFATEFLHHGDFVVQCTDGLHAYVLDDEIGQIVARHHPYDACRELLALAEKRGSDDNISLQIISVHDWEKVVHSKSPKGAGAKAVAGLGELAVGSLLDDRFELTDLISRSNMASIYRATDRTTGQAVALKVPLMALESDVAGFERFQREEEIGTRLNHPSILKVIKVEKKSRPYLVMEFLDGETLSQRLAKQRPLPEKEAARIAAQICDALAYLHANGVTHRDLKPQNIMLCRDGSLRLFDFGIAGVKQARRLTFVGFSPTMGTPDYMAPEQVKGKRGDQRTDIYSLGAILYEMTTGMTPFQGESPYVVMNARTTGDPVAPRKLNEKLTPVIEEITLHALERDPAKRYETASAMQKELENYEVVELVGRFQHLRSPETPGRSRQLWLIIGIVVAVQIVLFFILLLFLRARH
jgi:serine/threonine-protein kinase